MADFPYRFRGPISMGRAIEALRPDEHTPLSSVWRRVAATGLLVLGHDVSADLPEHERPKPVRTAEVDARIKATLEKHAAAAAARAATMRGLPNDIAKAEGYADGLADALAIAMSGDLARVLACERGDQSAAPPGWEWDCGEWYRDDDAGDVTVLRFAREWVAEGRRLPCSITAPTALEAMEAADAVLARQEDSGHG